MDIQQISDQIKNLDDKVFAAVIAAIASVIAALLSFFIQLKLLRVNTREKKYLSLKKQLEEFYIPFKTLLSKSAYIYKLLRVGLPSNFRTLVYLIDNDYLFDDQNGNKVKVTLDPNQLKSLDEIFAIEEELCKLIEIKGVFVENKSLYDKYSPNKAITDIFLNFDPDQPKNLPQDTSLFSLFLLHCHLIKKAYQGQLSASKISIYQNFVYPRELNIVIDNDIALITREMEKLR